MSAAGSRARHAARRWRSRSTWNACITPAARHPGDPALRYRPITTTGRSVRATSSGVPAPKGRTRPYGAPAPRLGAGSRGSSISRARDPEARGEVLERLFLFDRRVALYRTVFGSVRGTRLAFGEKIRHRPDDRQPAASDGYPEILLRLNTADVETYLHVMVNLDYDLPIVPAPATIIDAGAHIGLASVWFARHDPEATIVAIELESANYEVLVANTAPYPNIHPVNAALGPKRASISKSSTPASGTGASRRPPRAPAASRRGDDPGNHGSLRLRPGRLAEDRHRGRGAGGAREQWPVDWPGQRRRRRTARSDAAGVQPRVLHLAVRLHRRTLAGRERPRGATSRGQTRWSA